VDNGGADPSPAFGVSFYLSNDANITTADKFVCSKAADAELPGGQQVVVSSQCAIPAVVSGAYWLGAVADPSALITETDETNNDGAAAAQLQVEAPDVDLEYELHWDDGALPPNPGDTLTYHLQIRNNGTAASPAKFDANIHYSLDDSITLFDAKACTVSVGPVPALTITEFEFQCTVPQLAPGWYYSGVIIDPGNQVPETDESNNWGSAVNPELID
jgi:subtilase family serine protease